MRAIPQAIERSLATPMTRPRLPAISGPAWAISLFVMTSFLSRPQRARCPVTSLQPAALKRPTSPPSPQHAGSCVVSPENQRGIGTAETKAVRHDTVEIYVVLPLARDRYIREGGVEFIDVGTLADKAIVHHQQRVDRLLHPCGAQRV